MQKCLIIFAVFAFALSGCKKNKEQALPPVGPPPVVNPPAPGWGITYLALGDSYTIGQSVAPADRFPAQTKNWLLNNGIENVSAPEIIATTGWTTINLQSALINQNPTDPYDVVSLLIGVNDQYQRLNQEGYRTRFTQLLQKSIALAGSRPSHVFVLSIPDYSATPFVPDANKAAVRQEIDEFNVINRQIANSFNVQYLDITPSTREAATDASLLALDGLHPSGIEYGKWAALLGSLMKEVLK